MERSRSLSVMALSWLFTVAPADAAAEAPDAKKGAQAVVLAFNAAFARKDIEGVVSQLMEGGVQVDLRPAHADQAAAQSPTQELHARWYGVTPILFAAAQTYERKVRILDSRASAEMATVWAQITTNMRLPKSDQVTFNSFTEVYLLVNTKQGWKIAAMTDDRATDRLATGAPAGN